MAVLPTVAPVRTVTTVIYIHKNTIKTIVTVTVGLKPQQSAEWILASMMHKRILLLPCFTRKKKKGTEKKEGTDDCEKGNAEFTDARKR